MTPARQPSASVNWRREEAGWYTSDLGGICRERDGWYAYPPRERDDGWTKSGPWRTLAAAKQAVEAGTAWEIVQ